MNKIEKGVVNCNLYVCHPHTDLFQIISQKNSMFGIGKFLMRWKEVIILTAKDAGV
jgi:hypothetical protein